jgi:tripartite-type tricarboxylate transporter receptor subunit TctC
MMPMNRILSRAALLVALPALFINVRSGVADPSFKGQTITLSVGYAPGGGYDVYARVFAPFFGAHLPGNPTVVVQNAPGAGSMKLANDIYNVAPRDGTALGAIGREQITAGLFGVPGVRFDAQNANWLGTLDRAKSVCAVWGTTSFQSMDDAKQRQMIVGGTGPASVTVALPTALRDVLHYKIKVVSGYDGGNLIAMALERGEIDGRCGWSYDSLMASHPDWVKSGKLRVLAVAAPTRLPEFPSAPTVYELAQRPEDRQVLALILAGEDMARPLLAPPGVPQDRLAALRAAFVAAANDPAFIEKAREARIEISPADWRAMDDEIKRLYNSPAAVVAEAKRLISGDTE